MGKKKLSLKRKIHPTVGSVLTATAVNRGFATTSVQSKKAKEKEGVVKPDNQTGSIAQQDTAQSPRTNPDETTSPSPSGKEHPSNPNVPVTGGIEDWESEQAIDDSFYQDLVDRLQDKAEKEVSRIIKVCIFFCAGTDFRLWTTINDSQPRSPA